MTKSFLYRQIAEDIRRDILDETLHPGDRLPSVREMAERWQCTIGTVQRAYDVLAEQSLVVVRPGQGSHVAESPPLVQTESLRRANLVHRAESFLLEVLTAGYTQAEVEQAVQVALGTLANPQSKHAAVVAANLTVCWQPRSRCGAYYHSLCAGSPQLCAATAICG